jgi:hypothetical protein
MSVSDTLLPEFDQEMVAARRVGWNISDRGVRWRTSSSR